MRWPFVRYDRYTETGTEHLVQENDMSNPIEYTVKVYPNGTRLWYLNGKLHREDGPASEWRDGTREWYLNDELLSEADHAEAVAKLRNPNAELIARLAKAEAEVAAVRKELGQ